VGFTRCSLGKGSLQKHSGIAGREGEKTCLPLLMNNTREGGALSRAKAHVDQSEKREEEKRPDLKKKNVVGSLEWFW